MHIYVIDMGTMRGTTDSSGAAILSNKEKKDKSYCPECFKTGVSSPLKHRIYLDDKGNITTPEPDARSWRQCWKCGLILGIHEAKQEADLTSLPFKSTEAIIQTVDSGRKFDRSCKAQSKKKFKQDLVQYKEEDIKDALRKGAKLISYSES